MTVMNQFHLQEHPVEPLHGHLNLAQKNDNKKTDEVVFISTRFLRIMGVLFFFVVILGGASIYFKGKIDNIPKTYEECTKQKGSRSQHSIPDVCITLDGNYFVQSMVDEKGNSILVKLTPSQPQVTTPPLTNSPIPTKPTSITLPTQAATQATCKRSGCSGQLCVDIDADDVITTCEYRPEYSCYQEAPCEKQPNGSCGFTPSTALTQCLSEKTSAGRNVIQ